MSDWLIAWLDHCGCEIVGKNKPYSSPNARYCSAVRRTARPGTGLWSWPDFLPHPSSLAQPAVRPHSPEVGGVPSRSSA